MSLRTVDICTIRGFLGVSLSNATFSRSFASSLCFWIKEYRIEPFVVLLCDELESINYQVFRKFSVCEARNRANSRAKELQRMFNSIFNQTDCRVHCEIESETNLRQGRFQSVLSELHKAANTSLEFRTDLRKQVFDNLTARTAKHGREFIDMQFNIVSKYILEELALMDSFLQLYPSALEAYPGDPLWIRQAIQDGKYTCLNSDILVLGKFVNLSNLTISGELFVSNNKKV